MNPYGNSTAAFVKFAPQGDVFSRISIDFVDIPDGVSNTNYDGRLYFLLRVVGARNAVVGTRNGTVGTRNGTVGTRNDPPAGGEPEPDFDTPREPQRRVGIGPTRRKGRSDLGQDMARQRGSIGSEGVFFGSHFHEFPGL